jgi:hypothetical protein
MIQMGDMQPNTFCTLFFADDTIHKVVPLNNFFCRNNRHASFSFTTTQLSLSWSYKAAHGNFDWNMFKYHFHRVHESSRMAISRMSTTPSPFKSTLHGASHDPHNNKRFRRSVRFTTPSPFVSPIAGVVIVALLMI